MQSKKPDGYFAVAVCQDHWTSGNNLEPPKDEAQAARSVPRKGHPAVGIYVALERGADDLIYQACIKGQRKGEAN